MNRPTNVTGLRADTVAALRDVSRMAVERGQVAISGHLSDRSDRLDQGEFNLVVLGQFKRGKSTLINALVGYPILPMGVVPLTSVVTKVRFGRSEEVVVRFLDGTLRQIDLADIHHFVTEKENPRNRLGVDEVSVAVPSTTLSSGLVLVDTPGVGSTFEHNTDTALGFLPRADAGLFVLAADPPLSLAESEFLASVRPFVAKLFFVLNKSDYLTPDEARESLQFTIGQLEKALQTTDVEVLPVSAKRGLEGKQQGREDLLESSGLPAVEGRIERFMATGKTGTMLVSAGRAGAHACDALLGGIALEKRALQIPLEDMDRRVARLEEELQKAEAEQGDDLYLLDGEEKRLIERIENDLAEFRAAEQPRLQDRVGEIVREHTDLRGAGLRKVAEKQVFEEVEATFERFRPEEEARVDRYFSEVSRRFAERVGTRLARIQGLVSDLFEVNMGGFEAVQGLTASAHLWFLVNPPEVFFPTIDSLTLSAFLPGRRAAAIIERELEKKVAEEMDRNSGRLLGYFRQRIADSLRPMRDDLSRAIDEFVGTVRSSVKRAQDRRLATKGKAEPAIQELEAMGERVAAAKEWFIDLAERLTI